MDPLFELTREQVRRLDQTAIRDFHIPGIVLMENAGRGTADVLCRLGIEGRVSICCGRGNNGGDGLVIARHLDLRGFAVEIWTCGGQDGWPPDAATNLEIVRRSQIRLRHYETSGHDDFCHALAGADWILDGLLGTGAVGAPRAPLDAMMGGMNRADCRRMAIDIPSGLDCDTGVASEDTFRADHTCTFVTAKPGLRRPSAMPFVGELHIVDIGAPRVLLASFLPPPERDETP